MEESMKGVKSDYAAKAIAQACREQFPSKKSSKKQSTGKKEEVLNSRVEINAEAGPNDARVVSKVSFVEWEEPSPMEKVKNYAVMRIMNRNPFSISGVKLGINLTTPGNKWSPKESDYEYTLWCRAIYPEIIRGESSGKCVVEKFKGKLFVIGIVTGESFYYESDWREFLEKYPK